MAKKNPGKEPEVLLQTSIQLFTAYRSRIFLAIAMSFLASTATRALAQGLYTDNATVSFVAVNGGVDTANPGTTCFSVSLPVSSACASGFLAVPNNKQLLASVLQAKATGAKVWVYYEDTAPPLHCPGVVFTPCSVISVGIR